MTEGDFSASQRAPPSPGTGWPLTGHWVFLVKDRQSPGPQGQCEETHKTRLKGVTMIMRTVRANGRQVTSRLRKGRSEGGYAFGNGPPGPEQGEGSLREDARVSGRGSPGQEVQDQASHPQRGAEFPLALERH